MSLLLALLLDWFLGEPPARLHPVVWMGHYLKWAGRGLTDLEPRTAFLRGALFWLLGAAVVTLAYWLLALLLQQLPMWLELLFLALLLKPLFSFKLLLSEVQAVEHAPQESLDNGRKRLSFIVSRDTSKLTDTQVRESALESLAENLSDSLVAPLFWYALFGLPGAVLYRFANTADAMWGYRGKWEHAGKWAARVDDVLNYVPARITGLFLYPRAGVNTLAAQQLVRESQHTPSPNGGYPMTALALYLGVRLSKPNVYTLNAPGREANLQDSQKALQWCKCVGWSCALALSLVTWIFKHG
jgi:adenosylcobinamide-phosphate synthase